MFDLFGAELPTAAKFVIAFVAVLGLIGLTAWLVRRFGADRLGGGAARGRQPRLAVIDAASIDGRRRLVLIRRDNVEHLLMIGGPSDVVVEPNIVRASTRDNVRGTAADTTRAASLDNGSSWPLQPAPEPAPVAPAPMAPPRTIRASFGDDSWTANETPREPVREPAMREPAMREPAPREIPRPRPAPDSLTGMAADLSAKFNPPDVDSAFGRNAPPIETFGRTAPPVEPMRRAPEPPASGDHNLAEMASRLEAALRRPPQAEGRPPVTDPLAMAPEGAQRTMAPEGAQRAMAPPDNAPRVRAPEAFSTPASAPEIRPSRDNKPASKPSFDNLEQEMASLLGRPATKP